MVFQMISRKQPHAMSSFERLTARLFVAALALLLLATGAEADIVELQSGKKLAGKVLKRDDSQLTLELAGSGTVLKIPAGKVVKVTLQKAPPAPPSSPEPSIPQPPPKPAQPVAQPLAPKNAVRPPTPPKATSAMPPRNAGVTRSREEALQFIEEQGRAAPDWFETTPLNYSQTLDLTWTATKQWNSQRNLGQYIWDVVNPNPRRWHEGIRLLHHALNVNQNDPNRLNQTIQALAAMHQRLLGDHARAAFWWQQLIRRNAPVNAVALAECYWKLGNKEMAAELLRQVGSSGGGAVVKLWSEMGETEKALQLARGLARGAPDVAYLAAGDACRLDGRYDDALTYYQKVVALPDGVRQNKDVVKRFRDRARANIAAIRTYDTLDLGRIPDGKYRDSSIAYTGPLHVEVTVKSHRIEDVKVVRHTEKQYYSSIKDTTAQILEKQSVKGIDATTQATITAEAIVNATAKALAGGMK